VSSSSNEELEGLIGEKNIFDLNPGKSTGGNSHSWRALSNTCGSRSTKHTQL